MTDWEVKDLFIIHQTNRRTRIPEGPFRIRGGRRLLRHAAMAELRLSPGFAVSNQKGESERFLALNTRDLRERSSVRSMWDNLPSFQRVLEYGILGVR